MPKSSPGPLVEVEAAREVDGEWDPVWQRRRRPGEGDLAEVRLHRQLDADEPGELRRPDARGAYDRLRLDPAEGRLDTADLSGRKRDSVDRAAGDDGRPVPAGAGRVSCVTASGLAWPSSGEKVAASTPSSPAIGQSSAASSSETKRLGTPPSFCSATLSSNAETSSGWSRRKRYPTCSRSISAPGRSPKRMKASMLRSPIAMFTGSENWARKPPAARLVEPPASCPRSRRHTPTPASASGTQCSSRRRLLRRPRRLLPAGASSPPDEVLEEEADVCRTLGQAPHEVWVPVGAEGGRDEHLVSLRGD